MQLNINSKKCFFNVFKFFQACTKNRSDFFIFSTIIDQFLKELFTGNIGLFLYTVYPIPPKNVSPIPIPLIIPRELENNINDNKTVVTSFIFPAIDIVNADVFLLEINEVILTINSIIPLHNNSMLDLE